MQNCKPIDTPFVKSERLSREMGLKTPEERDRMAHVPYFGAVRSLMYAMICTCPEICYEVGLFSRYQSNPRSLHWKAIKRILIYLKETVDSMLCYQSLNLHTVW